MNAEEFKERAKDAMGGVGWQKRLSSALGVSLQTTNRWATGKLPVPEYAIAAIELLEELKKYRLPVPSRFSRK